MPAFEMQWEAFGPLKESKEGNIFTYPGTLSKKQVKARIGQSGKLLCFKHTKKLCSTTLCDMSDY